MFEPTPTDHHRKLQALVGEWTGDETMHPSPWDSKGGKATSRRTVRLDLGGFFLISDYVQLRDGRETYRGHGVYGWDARQGRYTMHWFDAMSGSPAAPALGTWEGNTLIFQHQHAMGHTRYTYVFECDGLYTFRLENSPDGKTWTTFLDGTYRRTA